MMLAADCQPTEVLQHQLLTVVDVFADDDGLIPTVTLGNRYPRTTGNAREPVLTLQNAREVQVNILTKLDDTVITQGIDKLLLGIDGDDAIDSLCHLRGGLRILVAHTVVIILSLLALQQLDIGRLDDIELDAVVIGHGLVPRLTAEMILQVLRLELPSVTGQDLITHQSQLRLRETP